MKLFKFVLSPLAAATLSLAAIALPGAAHADAIAQSILNVSNFTIGASNPGNVTFQVSNSNSNLSALLIGSALDSKLNQNNPIPNLTVCSGSAANCAGYTKFVPILTPALPTSTFAAGAVNVVNSALLPGGATARVESVTLLNPSGDGASTNNTQFSADFRAVLSSTSALTFNFDSFLFLRSFLSAAPGVFLTGNAISQANWSMNIKNALGANVFTWNPDGTVGSGITGGTETADAFSLNGSNNLSINSQKDFQYNSTVDATTMAFAASTNLLSAGTYTISVAHNTVANAAIAVPEPGSLALVGISLIGLAAVGRRRAMRQAA